MFSSCSATLFVIIDINFFHTHIQLSTVGYSLVHYLTLRKNSPCVSIVLVQPLNVFYIVVCGSSCFMFNKLLHLDSPLLTHLLPSFQSSAPAHSKPVPLSSTSSDYHKFPSRSPNCHECPARFPDRCEFSARFPDCREFPARFPDCRECPARFLIFVSI